MLATMSLPASPRCLVVPSPRAARSPRGVRALAGALAFASIAVLAAAQTPVGGVTPGPVQVPRIPIATQLFGRTLGAYPHFEYVRTVFEGQPLRVAVDPGIHPWIVGLTRNLWLVAHRTIPQWTANDLLVDVRGAPDSVSFVAGSITANTFTPSGALSGDAGLGLGVGYDVVLDMNANGRLDEPDLVDGYGDEAGFYVCKPTGVAGPLAVTEVLYNGGALLGQDIYYPTAIAGLGELPLVVVSHGNGHQYTWYDHIGTHLASWGCVVMSHTNDTMPGIEAASTTTLNNTTHFLANLATIAGGVLNGHVDRHKIIWIGHSRGGEGVVRAYDRLFDGTATSAQYTLADIVLISSIAPTGFLGTNSSHPHAANYHLWVGGADSDVSGCPSSDITLCFPLLKRSVGRHQSIELHGAGHGAFHAGGGSLWAAGPCLLTAADVHAIMRAELLPLVKHYTEGNVPAKDFLVRQWESFQSPGVPTNSCVVVDRQYQDGPAAANRVVDDYQTNTATGLSSSGGAVVTTLLALSEGRLDDLNSDFNYTVSETFNGMTDAIATDTARGALLAWTSSDRTLTWTLVPAQQDTRPFTHLSFRACQATRAPETTGSLGDLDFSVVLRDLAGNERAIRLSAYGGGVEEPYQRTSCGAVGAGWNNEWETIRIRLGDFTRDGSLVDLRQLASIEFRFGPSHGSATGRIGLDDLEFTRE